MAGSRRQATHISARARIGSARRPQAYPCHPKGFPLSSGSIVLLDIPCRGTSSKSYSARTSGNDSISTGPISHACGQSRFLHDYVAWLRCCVCALQQSVNLCSPAEETGWIRGI